MAIDTIIEDDYDGDERDFIFHDMRMRKDVAVPDWIYDRYLPLLGYDGIGLYQLYCRMAALPKHIRRRASQDKLAKAGRIGKSKLRRLNATLVELGFVRLIVPDALRKSRHIATHAMMMDPPDHPSQEAILKYGPADYASLDGWLFDALQPFDSAGPNRPAVEKARVHLDPRSKSAGPNGPAVAPLPEESAGPNGPANVLLNTHTQYTFSEEKDSSEENSEYEYESTGLMSSSAPTIAVVDQFKANLITELGRHGWIGGGWTWNDESQAAIVASEDALTGDAIEYALDQWYDLKDELFSPVFSLNWLIATCRNYNPGEQKNGYYPQKRQNGRKRPDQDYERNGTAELLDTPRPHDPRFDCTPEMFAVSRPAVA